jgi:thiol-disulfide isomerase/thioredoxin
MMRYLIACFFAACLLLGGSFVFAEAMPQQSSTPERAPTATTPAPGAASANADADKELEKAINDAGADSAKVVHNLQDFLTQFPNSPRKAAVYHALVQSCQKIRDDDCVLDYAEKLVAMQTEPKDQESLMIAVSILQQRGDAESVSRASGYVSTVIDDVQKLSPDRRPERLSLAEWQGQRGKLLMALLNVRGDIERAQSADDAAAKDYQSSFSTMPNPTAAKALGDIAESRRDWNGAADQYALALALPDVGPLRLDRTDVLVRLKSAWQQAHGNTNGLGDALLAAYERVPAPAAVANSAAKPNTNAKDVFDFVLRQLDGNPLPLAPLKGKVVVLSFWATWCTPCYMLEPILGDISKKYAANGDVAFLGVNADEDETLVPRYLARVKWELPVAYSNGLKEYLGVDAFPTVIILDRDGKTVFRVAGFPEEGYLETLTAAIHSVAGPPKDSHGD